MNQISSSDQFQRQVFDEKARSQFARCYPEQPHLLDHHLAEHSLLKLDALARLGTSLPETSVEYNPGDLPVGIAPEDVPSNGMTIADTILMIENSASWAVLKNIEQVPEYEGLLMSLLEEIRPLLEARTGKMLKPQGFVFVSSPGAMTPYHFDPEHNILLQLRGSKVMTQFPAGDPLYAADQVHESYHTGGPRELQWDDSLMAGAREFPIGPGEAVFVPVMAPHFVRNGPESSISLSITWRSEWSYSESEARAFNAVLRKMGYSPSAPGRWPHTNRAKSLGYKALRKLGLTQA